MANLRSGPSEERSDDGERQASAHAPDVRPELLSEANTTKPRTTFAKRDHDTGAFVPLSSEGSAARTIIPSSIASHLNCQASEICRRVAIAGGRIFSICVESKGVADLASFK